MLAIAYVVCTLIWIVEAVMATNSLTYSLALGVTSTRGLSYSGTSCGSEITSSVPTDTTGADCNTPFT